MLYSQYIIRGAIRTTTKEIRKGKVVWRARDGAFAPQHETARKLSLSLPLAKKGINNKKGNEFNSTSTHIHKIIQALRMGLFPEKLLQVNSRFVSQESEKASSFSIVVQKVKLIVKVSN